MTARHRFLFICRHNDVRSQIAAALTNKISKGRAEAISAGPEPQPVPEYVSGWIANLAGQNIKPQSQSLADIENQDFDTIITLCDKSHTALPTLLSDQQHIRWDFSHADNDTDLQHLEIELSERLRLMLLAKGLL